MWVEQFFRHPPKSVSKTDLSTLMDEGLLSDYIIDVYLKVIKMSCSSEVFYPKRKTVILLDSFQTPSSGIDKHVAFERAREDRVKVTAKKAISSKTTRETTTPSSVAKHSRQFFYSNEDTDEGDPDKDGEEEIGEEAETQGQNVYDFEGEATRPKAHRKTASYPVDEHRWGFFVSSQDTDEEEDGDEETEEEYLNEGVHTETRSRREKLLSESSIADMLHKCMKTAVPCCRNRCVTKFDPDKILTCRHDMLDRGSGRGQYILDMMKAADRRGDGQAKITSFPCQGHAVCGKAWYLLHGISRSSFYEYLQDYLKGKRTVRHGNTGILRRSPSYCLASVWLGEFAERYGDKMPDKIAINLPSTMTKIEVYQRYRKSRGVDMLKPIAMSTFNGMWIDEYPDLKIPETSRLGICDVCKDLRTARGEATTAEQREAIDNDLQLHNDLQMMERRVYWGKVHRSLDDPSAYLSIIIDGMDQNKTAIPHFVQKTKESEKWKLKTHVTGVLVHGLGQAFAYIDNLRWPHDSNLTCNVLLATLRMVSRMYDNKLPATLFLQMDNCWRECKNKFVFAFLGYLVIRGIFKEVQVGYLLVGHTHEDVDQFFSKIAHTLNKKRDATTVEELMHAIGQSFPNVKAWEMDALLDIKAFLGDVSNDMEQHSCPHLYRFTADHEKKLITEYKNYASDDGWRLPRNNEVRLVEQLPPAGSKPDLLAPRMERLEINQFEAGVTAMWQNGKLTTMQKMALDAYTAKQTGSAEYMELNKKRIVDTLWPEALMQAWAQDRPTPPPQLTQQDRNRIDNLYRSYNKSKKTSEPDVSEVRFRFLEGCTVEDDSINNLKGPVKILLIEDNIVRVRD
uniref:DUF7869 domain-containing protein n=1 Tax=Branchiostoma floridae TaxID=7739 RepID=C3YC28_BRAFL|eukprot:XP_002606193.1 hypothetical protein BRAFLDRAFT_92067 [Branchiostoma floridae]